MSARLTGRGVAFLVVGLLCLVLAGAASVPGLLLPAGLLLSLVVIGFVFVGWGHRRLEVDRVIEPAVVEPGQAAHVRLRVTNRSGLPCPEATWSDRLPRMVAGRASGRLPRLPGAGSPRATVETTFAVSSSTRGSHEIGSLSITVSDPFGVVRRRLSLDDTHRFTVLPHRYALDALRPRGGSDDGSTRPAPQHVGVGEEDVIARPYLPGDAMKRLHWKATAHRGELMVRQEERHLNPRAAVIVDLDATSHGTAQHRGEWEHSAGLEWVVSAAASITSHLSRHGFAIALTSHDGAVDDVVAEGEGSVRDAMISLAQCHPTEAAISAPVRERLVYLVTGRLDPARASQWRKRLGGDTTVLAIVAASTATAIVDELDDAGWSVAVHHPRSDIPDVWRDLDGGRARVPR